ncbi:MAG: hypothetical protein ABI480_09185 [Chitinophagaceae bacterium]
MKSIKEMIEQTITGIKNWFGPQGSFAGKYQLAVITNFKTK